MASPLLCDGSCRVAADPSCGGSGGSGGGCNSSNNKKKRRRRSFSSVPLQPAAVPPSPFSAPAPATERLEEAASPSRSQVRSASRHATRAAGTRSFVSLAAGMRAAAGTASPVEDNEEEEEEGRLQLSSRRRRRQPQDQSAGSSTASRTRGLLSRAATAAATAVAVAVSAPVGVGALMTEEQCEDATSRGTDAELTASPRLDTVTEAAAAGIDRTIVASQATYDRMVADQASIWRGGGVNVPFRNLWSDHEWFGTARVTFTDVETLGLFGEGSPPEFNCMNEYYGLSFERGEAVATPVYGTLEADKVLNWDVLSSDYLALEGLDSFVPTDVLTVPSTTFLVAGREESITEEFSAEFSEESSPHFHYFLSLPAEDVDASACPEPCTGEVVSYYWSQSAGTVYLLDRVAAVAEMRPCWLELFQTVAGGPPAGGVENALWEETGACTAGLLQGVEDAMKSGEYPSSASAVQGDGDGGGSGSGAAAVAAAVLISALLVSFAVVAFGLVRHQKAQRLKKMKTTEEAWGEGLDGARKPRPPTGRFKLGVTGAAVAEEGGGVAGGIARLKSFPPPEPVFTDVTVDDEDGGVGMTAAAGDEEEGRVPEDDEEGKEEDMIYPM